MAGADQYACANGEVAFRLAADHVVDPPLQGWTKEVSVKPVNTPIHMPEAIGGRYDRVGRNSQNVAAADVDLDVCGECRSERIGYDRIIIDEVELHSVAVTAAERQASAGAR